MTVRFGREARGALLRRALRSPPGSDDESFMLRSACPTIPTREAAAALARARHMLQAHDSYGWTKALNVLLDDEDRRYAEARQEAQDDA